MPWFARSLRRVYAPACVLACLLTLGGCALTRPEPVALPTPELRRQAGQMLLVGFRGAEPAPGTPDELPILKQIAALNLGGVILFDRDAALYSPERNIVSPGQLTRLTAALQAAAAAADSPPLFIAVDQEGGKVQRLRAARGFAETPPAAELCPDASQSATTVGAALAPALAAGEQVGATLASVGINLDFAPVADVNVNPQNPVIGALGRSFSANPAHVAACATAFAWGLKGQGVLTAAKHFPGHGSSTTDSHEGFTDVTETWTEAELIPFGELLRQDLADLVMTAHVFNGHLDPEHPATLSRPTVTGLLRGHLGFQGVVVTDDLQMRAVAAHYGFKEAIRLAVAAGADVLLIGNNLDYDENIAAKAVDALMELVAGGRVSPARIAESCARIENLKRKIPAARLTPPAGTQPNISQGASS